MDVRRVVAGIGRACIAAGVLILLFVAYQLWGTGLAEARSQDRLRNDFLDQLAEADAERGRATTTTTTTVVGDPTPQPTSTTAATVPDAPAPAPEGSAVAIIRIPKIGVEKAVIEGVGVSELKKGPGHYPSTPLPGQPGNAAIAGHRTTYGAPFFRLDELAAGDRIFVTTRQGEFTYRVREAKVVRPDQNEVLAAAEDNRLTLTTCHPRFSASRRLIVTAALSDEPAPAPPPAVQPPPTTDTTAAGEPPRPTTTLPAETPSLDEESLSGDSTARTPAIAWGSLAALVWLLAWLASRRWGRLAAYAFGTPVFLVVLFVFFENFARLLPANV